MTVLAILKMAVAVVVACIVFFFASCLLGYAIIRVSMGTIYDEIVELDCKARDPKNSWTNRFRGWK